ncbi:hypothetical protein SLEP1_g2445 [Rubroshorea leprosula]|uniref:Uncharacterized protein n=1 Tax=Rubroshorea leprosula TaxID=152421 RepID=A0AAV5HQJ1_9ROSI|nr:hypothetical protein SLEP1_g2445 [Rubroshorea leprosula]
MTKAEKMRAVGVGGVKTRGSRPKEKRLGGRTLKAWLRPNKARSLCDRRRKQRRIEESATVGVQK